MSLYATTIGILVTYYQPSDTFYYMALYCRLDLPLLDYHVTAVSVEL